MLLQPLWSYWLFSMNLVDEHLGELQHALLSAWVRSVFPASTIEDDFA
jgi:hypothetical protein